MPGLVFRQRIGGLPCISGAENRAEPGGRPAEATDHNAPAFAKLPRRSMPKALTLPRAPPGAGYLQPEVESGSWAPGCEAVHKTIENRERYRPPWQLRRLPKATAVYVIDISIRLSATDRIRPKTTGCQERLPVPQDLKIFTKN